MPTKVTAGGQHCVGRPLNKKQRSGRDFCEGPPRGETDDDRDYFWGLSLEKPPSPLLHNAVGVGVVRVGSYLMGNLDSAKSGSALVSAVAVGT